MAKQVAFPSRPRARTADLDAFVQGEGAPQPEAGPVPAKRSMKRLTFDIPSDLHMRMKIGCVREGRDMAEALRELIAQRWP